MATALANPGGVGTEFLLSRVKDRLSANQRSTFVTLNSRRAGFTISSRSAAFLCVASAGNLGSQGGGQGLSESAKGSKKKPYFRKKRSATKKKKDEAVDGGEGEVTANGKNDLRALLSNSAVSVFSEGIEVSEELEAPQLSTDDDDAGSGNPLGRRALGKAVVSWMKEGISAMVREVACAQERGEIKEAEERMGTGHNLVALAQPYLLARPMPEGLEPLCLRASLHYPTIFDHYQRELRVALQASQFSEYIQKNIMLYQYKNGIPLSTSAAANFTRVELATALRKNPYQVNMMIAGWDKDVGPSLYYLDYISTLHKLEKGGMGYGAYFLLSLMDRYFEKNMSLEKALVLVDKCIDETIKQLFAMGSELDTYFSIRSLLLHSMSFFVLFNLAYGVATPGGIFMPSIMVGASFGAFLGRVFQAYFPEGNIQPGLHALVGATAMLGGVFRSSLSLVVIMMEGTGGLQYLLPAIIAIYVGNWVAHHIHNEGAYEADLERLGEVRFLQSEPPRHLISVTAAENNVLHCPEKFVYKKQ